MTVPYFHFSVVHNKTTVRHYEILWSGLVSVRNNVSKIIGHVVKRMYLMYVYVFYIYFIHNARPIDNVNALMGINKVLLYCIILYKKSIPLVSI